MDRTKQLFNTKLLLSFSRFDASPLSHILLRHCHLFGISPPIFVSVLGAGRPIPSSFKEAEQRSKWYLREPYHNSLGDIPTPAVRSRLETPLRGVDGDEVSES